MHSSYQPPSLLRAHIRLYCSRAHSYQIIPTHFQTQKEKEKRKMLRNNLSPKKTTTRCASSLSLPLFRPSTSSRNTETAAHRSFAALCKKQEQTDLFLPPSLFLLCRPMQMQPENAPSQQKCLEAPLLFTHHAAKASTSLADRRQVRRHAHPHLPPTQGVPSVR